MGRQDGRVSRSCSRSMLDADQPEQMQSGRRMVRKLTQGPMEVLQRWHQHFSKLLNQQSAFDEEAIQQMQAMPPWLDLDEPPTEEELETALSKLKKSKVGGKTSILPELVMFGDAVLWNRLLELMQVMWRKGEVVTDWKNVEVVLIPKKGDLQRCDNW